MRRLMIFLSSIRLMLPLLGVHGLVALIGVIIPQDGDAAQYTRKYGSGFAAFLTANGWHHIFSSAWFLVPLALFCLNLLLCVGKRAGSLVRIVTGASRETPVKAFTWGAYGSLVLHAGLLFLVAGGIIQYYRGATQMVMLAEGEKQPAGDFPFSVALRHFTIDRNAEGATVNYRSGIDLIDRSDSLLRSGETRVNAPLSWKNFSLYQATYGYLPDAFKKADCSVIDSMGDTLFSGTLPFGKAVPMKGNNRLLLCDRFECDFVLDIQNRTIGSRSQNHNNPAFHFMIIQNDTAAASQWIFLNQTRRIPALADNIVSIEKYDPAFFSGIQIKKNAGTGFIWTGLASVSCGLLAIFLFPMRPRSQTSAPANPDSARPV
jgi:cytochrome c biogenesis protein ResB